MSKVEVNQVTQQCGTTLTVGGGACKTAVVDATTVTLGRCGGTVSLASGATQTGFGRTGTVDWQTASIKTAGFTPTNGEGYFCNTNGGIFTITLPAGSAGNIVAFADYTRTFNTNNLTISPNGAEKIGGAAADAKLSVNGQSATFVYVDGTEGWVNINETQTSQTGVLPAYVTATGGTPCSGAIVCTNYKVHTFTGPGTFTVSCAGNSCGSNTVSYVVVAGGAGGGGSNNANVSAGGGAGGYRESKAASDAYTASPLNATCGAPGYNLPVSATPYSIDVGGGGTGGGPGGGGAGAGLGGSGNNSVFSTITSAGGGGGGNGSDPGPYRVGVAGGSGGGGGGGGPSVPGCGALGGTGNTPPTTPAQGTAGGKGGWFSPDQNSAGGGGAGAVGQDAVPPGTSGAGGAGVTSCITASSVIRAGGGGGAAGPGKTAGAGGPGGGGAGGPYPGAGTAGLANTGGAGGGGGCAAGGSGGGGTVIIRYKFQ